MLNKKQSWGLSSSLEDKKVKAADTSQSQPSVIQPPRGIPMQPNRPASDIMAPFLTKKASHSFFLGRADQV